MYKFQIVLKQSGNSYKLFQIPSSKLGIIAEYIRRTIPGYLSVHTLPPHNPS